MTPGRATRASIMVTMAAACAANACAADRSALSQDGRSAPRATDGETANAVSPTPTASGSEDAAMPRDPAATGQDQSATDAGGGAAGGGGASSAPHDATNADGGVAGSDDADVADGGGAASGTDAGSSGAGGSSGSGAAGGSGAASGSGGTSGGEPGGCDPSMCPEPAPATTELVCPDGSIAGPICAELADESCGWTYRRCEDASCDDVACADGTHCELVASECAQPTCPQVARCVPDAAAPPACGGFANLECPGFGTCRDDPTDGCDPQFGGADCPGVCACQIQRTCSLFEVWNPSPEVCACESTLGCELINCSPGSVCELRDGVPTCVELDD